MPRKSHYRRTTSKSAPGQQPQPQPLPDALGFDRIGPISIEGIEARDFPDKGRGPIETEKAHEAKRTLPQQSGAIDQEGGMRASLDISDADRHGH
jgi:hypothetical protein